MPELPDPKFKPDVKLAEKPRPATGGDYAELEVTSNFSFLRGASHPEELVARAAELGCRGIALTDINTLAGVVRGHAAAKQAGVPFIVGCRVVCGSGHPVPRPEGDAHPAAPSPASGSPEPASLFRAMPLELLVYPADRAGYGRLCRMLTRGKRRAAKGHCHLTVEDVLEHQSGWLAAVVPPAEITGEFVRLLRRLREAFDDDRLSLAASSLYDGRDRRRLAELADLSRQAGVPLVATNDVHYHLAARRELQDVLTCIRLGCTISQAGFALFANSERHMKAPSEMQRLFRDHPDAARRTLDIAGRAAAFSLNQLKYDYPSEVCPPGKTPMQHLVDRTWQGAAARYPGGVPESVRTRLAHEFELIEALNYPAYFLTVDDIVRFARSRGILCQGRGAAANSAVCYCLGVTAVDPARIDLLVERFISRERDEPPDIDIDFEHERREEVIQYLYRKYGRERAALTAEVITYRRRSAVREVGKALGLSLDCVDRLAKSGDWWDREVINESRLRELGLDGAGDTLRQTVKLAGQLLGFPRHLSQHVGGFVLTQGPLCESVPIENAAMPDRTVIEWDKDDIDELGMLKVDVLGLGMLTCIRKALEFVNASQKNDQLPMTNDESNSKERSFKFQNCIEHGGFDTFRLEPSHLDSSLVIGHSSFAPLELHTIPPEDPAVYDMLCAADSVGVFQVESRAQMTMLPRLKPRCYYDLVIEVAIVRPGPIQGGMVHPYLRRRSGQEAITYPSDAVKKVLERTLGVPLFQEQAMRLVMVAAGFTAGEADQLRRAMAAWKRKGDAIHRFAKKIVAGMTANGYSHAYALRVVEQIKGFSDYGFPESHAASFALLVYVSAWLKKHHPAAFAAALINSQPMGFYQPAQLVRDACEHGVKVLPADVNASGWDCRLETPAGDRPKANGHSPALRLGMRLITGMREKEARAIEDAVRRHGPFHTPESLWRAAGIRAAAIRTLATADAFRSMGLDRQSALWAAARLRDERLPMFDGIETAEPAADLPPVPLADMVVHDYAATGLSLKAHPVSFVRPRLRALNVTPAGDLMDERRFPHGTRAAVAGLVLVRQRPGTASGIVFMTIEDETGIANLVVRPAYYEQYRRALRHSVAVLAWGRVERQGQVVHVLVDRAANLQEATPAQETVKAQSRDFH